MASVVYLWSVQCASNVGVPYWQAAQVASDTDPSGGTCTDGSIILQALQGSLAPNDPTSTVIAPGDTLAYGEVFAYTGTGIKLAAGNAGDVLTSQGSGAALQWAPVSGSGTVTSVATGTGLTGGTITTTGTISFASAPDKSILGTSTAAGAPTPIVLATGDMITNTGTSLVLPGNTTTAKMVLQQTGTGIVSAVPQWNTLSGGDITGAALTATDDTNVTLTLGGSPATSLLRATSLTLGWTSTLAAPRGGTGFGSYTVGAILYADTTTSLARLIVGTDGYVLSVSSGLPSWQPLSGLGVTSITGTANQVLANNTSGSAQTGAVTVAFADDAKIVTSMGVGVAPSGSAGTVYVNTGLGVGVTPPTTAGYAQINSILGVGVAPSANNVIIVGGSPTATAASFSVVNLGMTTVTGQASAASPSLYGQSMTGTFTFGATSTGTGSLVSTYLNQTQTSVTGPTTVNMYGLWIANVQNVVSGPTTTNAYGLYVTPNTTAATGTLAQYAGVYVAAGTTMSGTITTAYGGYFATPVGGSTKMALYAYNASIGSGVSATAPPTDGLLVQGSILNQALTAFAPVGTDTSKNLVSLTTGISNSGYVLTSTGASSVPTFQDLATLGVTSITGTQYQVLANATFGSAQVGPVTLTLPATIIGPGSIQSTTTMGIVSAISTTVGLNNGFTYTGAGGVTPYAISTTGTFSVNTATTFATVAGLSVTNTMSVITTSGATITTGSGVISTPTFTNSIAGGVITTASGLYTLPTFNGTSAAVTTAAGLYLALPVCSGTVTTAYGIYNNAPAGATTNYGYYQTGAFTKTGDTGLQLTGTFIPTSGSATNYVLRVNPSGVGMSSSGGTVTAAYLSQFSTTFTGTTNVITNAYGIDLSITNNTTTATAGVIATSTALNVTNVATGSAAGSITTLNCIRINPVTRSTATIGTYYGINVLAATAAATTGYGVAINAPTGATTNYGLWINNASTKTADVGALITGTFTPAGGSANIYGLNVNPTFSCGGGVSGVSIARFASTISNNSASNVTTAATGVEVVVATTVNTASASIFNESIGISVQNTVSGNNSGSVTTLYGIRINSITASTASIGTHYGIYIWAPTASASTKYTGIFIGAGSGSGPLGLGIDLNMPTGATTNYGLRITTASTKTTDVGALITGTFIPTSGSSTNYVLRVNPSGVGMSSSGGTVTAAYLSQFSTTFTGTTNVITNAYGMDLNIINNTTTATAGVIGTSTALNVTNVATGSAAGSITTMYNIRINPTTSSTATIGTLYGLSIDTATAATTTASYGIVVNVPTGGVTNYGYWHPSTAIMTKSNDIGMYLQNTFTPAAASATLYQLRTAPTFNTSTGSINITAAYDQSFEPSFVPTTNTTTPGVFTTACAIRVAPTVTVSNATALAPAITTLYGMYVNPASIALGGNASHRIANYYGIYVDTVPAITGTTPGIITNMAGGRFAAPTTTSATTAVALWADSVQIGGASLVSANGTAPTGTVNMQILTAFAPVGTDTSKNLVSLTTGISNSGYVLTSTGASSVPTFQDLAALGVTSITGTQYQVLANNLYTPAQIGAITLKFADDAKIVTSLGVGVVPSGVSGQISGATAILTGAPSVKSDVFAVQTSAGVRLATVSGTTGTDLYIGLNAGKSTPGVLSNVFVGESAGTAITSGTGNVAVGYQALNANTIFGSCTSVGYQANFTNNSFAGLTSLGYQAGYTINAASANQTAIGYQAGKSGTGVDCTYIGYLAGSLLTTGTNNTCVGSNAGKGASTFTASDLTIVGFNAGLSITTGSFNTLIGGPAGVLLTTGSNNVAVGVRAMNLNTTFDACTAIGYYALHTNNAAAGLTAVGYQAGYTMNTANAQLTAVGYKAGFQATGADCTYIGYLSGGQLTSGIRNTCVGSQAGYGANTYTANNLTAVGYYAGFSVTTGGFNTLIGTQAGQAMATAGNCVAIGYQAQNSNTSSGSCTSVGFQANYTNNSFAGLVALGYQAGYTINDPSASQTAVGYQAGYSGTGIYCTHLGHQAGYNLTSGVNNTCIGAYCGYSLGATHTAGELTAVGYRAGLALTTGNQNTLMGSEAGTALTTGGANVMIGYQAGSLESTNSNRLYIANSNTTTPLIFGDFSTAALTVNGSARVTTLMAIVSAISTTVGLNNGFTYTGAGGVTPYAISTTGTFSVNTATTFATVAGLSVTNTMSVITTSGATITTGAGVISKPTFTNSIASGVITNASGLYTLPTFNGTSAAVTRASSLYLDLPVCSGTVLTAYGIYNNAPVGATTNYGYYQSNTTAMTKSNDIGMYLQNTFTPAAASATLYQLRTSPTFNTSTGSINITAAYDQSFEPNFVPTTNTTTPGVFTTACAIRVAPTVTVSNATALMPAIDTLYGVYVNPASIALGGNASHRIANYYGLYVDTVPAITGTTPGIITNMAGGRFAAPTTTSATTAVALWADSIQIGGASLVSANGTATTGTVNMQTLTAFAPVGADTNKNLVSLTTGISNSGYVLTSTGASSVPTFQDLAALGVTSITGTQYQVLANNLYTPAQIGAVTLKFADDAKIVTSLGVGVVPSGVSGQISGATAILTGAPSVKSDVFAVQTSAGVRLATVSGTTGTDLYIGLNAGKSTPGVLSNVFVGESAGTAITTGAGNVAVGYQAQNANTTLGSCTSVGYQANFTNNSFAGLTSLGYQAGYTVNAASANQTAVGYQAGYSGTGVDCTYLGYLAGSLLTTGTQNTCVGSQAGKGASTFTANNLTAVGYKAGYSITTGASNTLIGSNSGLALLTGASCTYVGYSAGSALTAGDNNTFVGTSAGVGSGVTPSPANCTAVGYLAGTNLATNGDGNTFVGRSAGASTTVGSANVAMGYQAASSGVGQTTNTAIGYQALSLNNSASGLTAVGYRAGYTMDTGVAQLTAVGYQAGTVATGVDCTYVGYNAGSTLTTGTQNTCVGSQAGKGASTFTANNLTAVGYKAGFAITSGAQNTLVGSQAGIALTSGVSNVAVGHSALSTLATLSFCTAVGYDALGSNNSSSGLTAVGYRAGFTMNTASAQLTAVGYGAGFSATGVDCTYIGHNAGLLLTSGANNTCVGSQAGYASGATFTAGNLTAIGYKAGYAITTGASNTLVGSQAGVALTTGTYNVAVGYQAQNANTTFGSCTSVGYQANFTNNSFSGLTALGYQAGYTNNNASGRQTAIGYKAGYSDTGQDCTYMGYSAGMNLTSGSFNTCVGSQACTGASLFTAGSLTAVGYKAGFALTTGSFNTLVGSQAGTALTTGANNVAVGYQALISNLALADCTAVGHQALFNNNASAGLTAVGYQAGFTMNTALAQLTAIGYLAGYSGTGVDCTYVGYQAGRQLTSGANNTCLGSQAGWGGSLYTAADLTAVGFKAGFALTTGNKNTLVGSSSGVALTSGANNVAVGYQAQNASTTIGNCTSVGYQANFTNNAFAGLTSLGYQAGYSINAASANQTAIGYQAGYSGTGVDCTYLGYLAGSLLTSGTQNTCVGSQAGKGASLFTASDLTAVGYKAGFAITTGSYNTLVGSQAGVALTTGTYNVMIGYQAGKTSTTDDCTYVGGAAGISMTGTWNTCIGSQAGGGTGAASATLLTAVGYLSGGHVSTGTQNTTIGAVSAPALTTGADTTAVGYRAMNSNTTFDGCTAVGSQALYTNNSAAGLTAVGYQAGYTMNTASANQTVIGYQAGYSGTGVDCTYVGYLAGSLLTSGANNTCVGSQAGKGASLFTASNMTAVGFKAGYAITTGTQNTLIGSLAAQALTSSSGNVAIGYGSLNALTATNGNCVAIGNSTLSSNNAAGDCVAIGASAGFSTNSALAALTVVGFQAGYTSNAVSANLTAVGQYAGFAGSTATDCTYVGFSAGRYLTTGNQNTCVGSQAGTGATTFTAGNLTAVGYKAGFAVTTGSYNTLIGCSAGVAITTGVENVSVGYLAGQANATFHDCTAIGTQALFTNSSSSNLTAVGFAAGYTLNAASATLTAVGFAAGRFTTATDNTYIGHQAGQNLTSGTQNTCVGSQAGFGATTFTAGNMTAVGYNAGYAITTGNQNTLVGSSAGAGLTSGGANVMIGYQAGSAETTNSNKLYISNSNTATPLIYGDFGTPALTVNGALTVTGNITNNVLTAFAPVGTDTSKNLVSLTTGISNSGYVLTSTGASSVPTFQDLAALGVTSIIGTANQVLVNGVSTPAQIGAVTLTLPQSIGTSSSVQFGSLALTTPLPATSGGTGFASYTVGDTLYASTTTALARLAAVATGSLLVSAGTSTAPAWSTTPAISSTLRVGTTTLTPYSGVCTLLNGKFNITDGNAIQTYGAGMLTQLNGQILQMGLNANNGSNNFGGTRDAAYPGGWFRFETRTAYPFWQVTTHKAGDATAIRTIFSSWDDGSCLIGGVVETNGGQGTTAAVKGTGMYLSVFGGVNIWGNYTGITATNGYGLLVGTLTSGTITNAYGVAINWPTIGTTNYGLWISTASTKTNDVGALITGTFIPTSGSATNYVLRVNPSGVGMSSSGGTVTAAYLSQFSTTFTGTTNVITNAYGMDLNIINNTTTATAGVIGTSTALNVTNVATGSAAGSITTMYNIRINPTTSSTATIGTLYGLSIDTATAATTTASYGIVVNVPTGGVTNYGYWHPSTAVMTKSNDIGMYLQNTFTPAAASATLYQTRTAPTFNTSTGSINITAAYDQSFEPSFVPTTNTTTPGVFTTACAIRVAPTVTVSNATALAPAISTLYGVYVKPTSIALGGNASHRIANYYGIYVDTVPAITGTTPGIITNMAGGRFAAPTTTSATTAVALWADSIQIGGASLVSANGTAATGTVNMQTLTTFAPVGADTNKNLVSLTTGISTSGYVLTSTGSSSVPTFQLPVVSGSSSTTVTGPNSATMSMSYYWHVLGGKVCFIFFDSTLQTWSSSGTSALSWTVSAPSAGSLQRFVVQTFQNNVGQTGVMVVSGTSWTAYLTTALGSFTGGLPTTGTIYTTICYSISS